MKAAASRPMQRYLRLARRERALVMAATLVAILGLGWVLAIEPALLHRARLARQMQQQRAELATLAPQVAALQARQRDPDAATRAQLEALGRQLRLAEGEFGELQRALVAPHEMGELLDGLLRSHGGLQLVGLRNAPVASVAELLEPPAAAPPGAGAPAGDKARAKDAAWLYRHGVEIVVQGRYGDLVAYLDALERGPRRVYWGELRIDAQSWPVARMTVTVYTISLEKTWWRV